MKLSATYLGGVITIIANLLQIMTLIILNLIEKITVKTMFFLILTGFLFIVCCYLFYLIMDFKKQINRIFEIFDARNKYNNFLNDYYCSKIPELKPPDLKIVESLTEKEMGNIGFSEYDIKTKRSVEYRLKWENEANKPT